MKGVAGYSLGVYYCDGVHSRMVVIQDNRRSCVESEGDHGAASMNQIACEGMMSGELHVEVRQWFAL
jgi:hypothetical protein